MHYSAGLAGLTTAAAATALPAGSGLFLVARLLLDGAGALFGLYLVTFVALSMSGMCCDARRARHPAAGQPF